MINYSARRGIGKVGVTNQKYSSGIGYVIIPTNTDRNQYIQKCLRTGMIGVLTEYGAVLWNVQCNKQDLNFLQFPEVADLDDNASKGSAVVYVNLPCSDNPVVVSIIDRFDEGSLMKEHQFKFIREYKDGYVEVSGKGDSGDLYIVASNSSSGGSVNISATSANEDAQLNLFTQGDTNIQAEGNVKIKATNSLDITVKDATVDDLQTTIKYTKGVGLEYVDEFENEITANEDNVQIKAASEINLGDGAEPVVLGDTLESFLDDLATQIKAITVPTAFGPSGTPINAAAITSLINSSLAAIKSSYSNTD